MIAKTPFGDAQVKHSDSANDFGFEAYIESCRAVGIGRSADEAVRNAVSSARRWDAERRAADLRPGVYVHKKGGKYTVLMTAFNATNAADRDPVVVYVSHTNGNTYVRNVMEFTEEVEWPDGLKRPRFCAEEAFTIERRLAVA